LISTVLPTGLTSPKMSVASSSPRKTTRRRCSSSATLIQRPPGDGIVLAALAVRTLRAEHAAVDGLALRLHRGAPGHDFAVHALELRHLRAEQVDVVDARTDRAAGRHALPRLRRLAGPHHGEVLTSRAAVLVHLPLEAFAEREQQQDRHRAPRDRGDGEERALLLQLRRAGEEGADDVQVVGHLRGPEP
jgi:hypothetical protein